MAIQIDDDETMELAKKLSDIQHLPESEVVRRALANELERLHAAPDPTSIQEKVAAIQARLLASAGPGGLPADRKFIDSLYED